MIFCLVERLSRSNKINYIRFYYYLNSGFINKYVMWLMYNLINRVKGNNIRRV